MTEESTAALIARINAENGAVDQQCQPMLRRLRETLKSNITSEFSLWISAHSDYDVVQLRAFTETLKVDSISTYAAIYRVIESYHGRLGPFPSLSSIIDVEFERRTQTVQPENA